jgi:transcriptional regulator with XRE-family HTH domain
MAKHNPGFSERLTLEIRRCGWCKRDFAAKVGIHENSVSKYTRRGGVPEWDVLVRIAGVLDRSVEWLLTGSDRSAQIEGPRPPQALTLPEVTDVGPARRIVYQLAGIKEEDVRILTSWFACDTEASDLLIAWAKARLSRRIADDASKTVEVQVKAMASYLLGKCHTIEEDEARVGR